MNSEEIVPREEFENIKGVVYGYNSSHICGGAMQRSYRKWRHIRPSGDF